MKFTIVTQFQKKVTIMILNKRKKKKESEEDEISNFLFNVERKNEKMYLRQVEEETSTNHRVYSVAIHGNLAEELDRRNRCSCGIEINFSRSERKI